MLARGVFSGAVGGVFSGGSVARTVTGALRPSLARGMSHRGVKPVIVPDERSGIEILHDATFNKGTGFTGRELDRLGLRGLVPPRRFTIHEQLARVYEAYSGTGTGPNADIAKFTYLMSLQDRNETLFFRLLLDRLDEMAPIVYTPTVGKAALRAGQMFRASRGLYVTANDRDDIHSIVQNWPEKDVSVIVVTDGSRILGLGDLGAHGHAIPIGKLVLYVAAGGIPPRGCLPITIDVGTSNKELRDDPFYLGLNQPRISDDAYVPLVDELMDALHFRWPGALVQFEDFKSPYAERFLTRYRNKYTMFNDDIQGTGAVTLGGLMAAVRGVYGSTGALCDQRIVVVGAGSAGVGVSNAIATGMSVLSQGRVSAEEARRQFWLMDKDGCVVASRADLVDSQRVFERSDAEGLAGKTLEQVCEVVKPTILLGLSGCGGIFTPQVLSTVARHVERPIIFSMSNPTHLSECTADDAYTHTHERCLFASGSPFAPVRLNNGTTRVVSQANNMFIFPGIGLGVTAARASRVTDTMLVRAAEILSECVTEQDVAEGRVYPRIQGIRDVSLRIAAEVGRLAQADGTAACTPDPGVSWEDHVAEAMWFPDYAPLIRQHSG